MKKIYLSLLAGISLMLQVGTASAQLTAACSPTYSSGSTSWYVTSFTLGAFTHSPASSTHNYTNLSFTLNAGSTYAISAVSLGFCGVSTAIDFNNNGVLNDPDELLTNPSYIATSPATYNFNITIPPYVLTGSYRFRIFNKDANSGAGNPNGSPCGTYGYGSWVDYTVNVVNSATCLPPSGLAVTNILPFSADLSWVASTSSPAGYTWKVVNQGQDPNLVAGISGYTTGTTASVSGLASLTNHQLFVQSDCGSGTSVWSLAKNFSTPCSALPTGGTAATANATPCLSQNVNYSLSGHSTGVGITFQWEDSLSTGTSWTPISGATSATSSIALATSGVHYLRAAVSCGVLTSYSTPVSVSISAFPGGTYTIDATASTTYPASNTFSSFSSAISAISCGITGPVVFNVVASPVPYNEQVTIPAVGNTSATNTVTFNCNGDTLVYNATASGSPWTLGLNGSDNFIFNDLVVRGTHGTYALVCHLWNQANNNAFNNCTFMAPPTGTVTTQAAFSVSGTASSATATGNSGSGNVLTGCTMFSGYYSATFVGNSGAAVNTGNKLINCNLRDFYIYGCYFSYQNGAEISGSTIERPTRSTVTTFNGVYITTGCSNSLVEKNKIRNPLGGVVGASTTAAYGVYRTGAGISGNEDLIYNNLITDFHGNGTNGGLYLTSATYVKAYHNTIVLASTTSTAGTTYGIYATGTAGVDIKNNLINITRSGTGTKYCLYFTGAGKTSNNNDLYINAPAGTNYIGSYTTTSSTATTLSAWQAVNSSAWDQQSVNADPMFFGPALGDYTPTNGLLDNMGAPLGFLTDILNASRSVTTPDIGAYEFSTAPCSGSPTAGTISGPTAVCPNAPFTLQASGFSVGTGLSYQWQEYNNLTSSWNPAPGTNNNYSYTSVGINAPTDYRFLVTCANGGGFDITSMLSTTVNPFYNCYCTPVSTCTNEGIENVSISTLNNASAYCTTSGYSNYTSLPGPPSIMMSQPTAMSVSARINSNPASAAMWIDYDHSGTFDATEFTAFPNAVGITPLPTSYGFTANITVPATALSGITGMRIRTANQSGITAASACNTATVYGEYEDYLVDLLINPLSIRLTNISATNVTTRNKVNWTTATEASGDYFTIEKSTDGRSFLQAGTVASKGSGTTYTWWDEAAAKGISYYRLKMTDASGGFTYSEIVTATLKENGFSIVAYPNPITDVLKVRVSGDLGSNVSIVVSDLTGKEVGRTTLISNEATINMSEFAPGMYFIKYSDSNHREIIKVIKK